MDVTTSGERFEAWSPARADAIIAAHAGREGPLLPILLDVQAAFGCVPPEAVRLIAGRLNLTRAEVHGVVSFYHDLRREPPGARTVKLCRAEACQARGGEAIASALLASLGLPGGDSWGEPWGGTTADGAVAVEGVYCLGLCAVAPAALIDGEPCGRLTPETLEGAVAPGRGRS